MAKFHPPEPLDFTCPDKWEEWKRRFHRFRLATKLSAESEEIQVASLIYAMGAEAETIFAQFTFANDDDKKWAPVIKAFDEHFSPQ